MITDVLHKAMKDLEYYQVTYPRIYDPIKPEIDHVKTTMHALGAKLDAVPKETPMIELAQKTEVQIISEGYRKPTMPHIGNEAARLYEIEALMEDTIDSVAQELANVLRYTPAQKWTHTMPEVLAHILESYDHNASILAAITYLESKGFKISPSTNADH